MCWKKFSLLGDKVPIFSSFPCQSLSLFWGVQLFCTHEKYKLLWCFWKGREKTSHICGLWMLITVTFRCVTEGPMAGASWERPSEPRRGAHWGSSGTAHTRKYMLQKEVPFFIKILHLSSPDQDLSLMGCRGYLTKSAVLCCNSSLTGDFCKYSQWQETLWLLLCQWVSSVGDKTQTLLLETFKQKTSYQNFS